MRSQNKLSHHSVATGDDFCCGFCAFDFGRGLVSVLRLSTGGGATDMDGSGVATGGVSSGLLSTGHGGASLMRLAIVEWTSCGGLSLVWTKSNPGEKSDVCTAGDCSTRLSSEAKAA